MTEDKNRRCVFPYACGETWCDCDENDLAKALEDKDIVESFGVPELIREYNEQFSGSTGSKVKSSKG